MSKYENHNLEAQALPFIYKERTEKHQNKLPGSANWHENIEILYILSENGSVFNNGEVISVSSGDIVVINANHLHTLSAVQGPLLHRYLIIDRSFCLANGVDTSALSFDVQIQNPLIRDWMEELHVLYTSPASDSYRTLSIRSLVLRILLLLCTEHASPLRQDPSTDRGVAYVKQAIDYIRASYEKDFSLDDVANFVGINKCYLSREFHKYTGYSFVSYVNLTRCKMAQQLLADERISINEAGKRCGFPNRSYFAKCFRRYMGMLPGEYRDQLLKNPSP